MKKENKTSNLKQSGKVVLPIQVGKQESITEKEPEVPFGKEFKLIDFTKKVKITLGVFLVLFSILVFLKISGSSVSVWNQVFGITNSPTVDIISGQPRAIRQDEWMVSLTAILSSYNQGFPEENYSIGYGKVPILSAWPAKNISQVLMPSLWGYHLLDIERGYSFYWNYKLIGGIVGVFLLLLIITKNNYTISLGGSIILFLSGGLQWWFSTWLSDYIVSITLVSVSALYLLYGKNRIEIVLAGIGLIFFGFSFIIPLYPALQVPFAYFFIIIVLGTILNNWQVLKSIFVENVVLRGIVFVISMGILVFFLFKYYVDASATIEAMRNTVYPGKRVVVGGSLAASRFFSGFFGYYITDVKVPSQWLNICEASNYVMFFPIILVVFIWDRIVNRKNDFVLILFFIFLFVSMIWMFVGLPSMLSQILGLNMVPEYRLMIPLGFLNFFILFYYLSNYDIKINYKVWHPVVIFIAAFIFFQVIGSTTNKQTSNFFKSGSVLFVSVFFSILYLLLFIKDKKYVSYIFMGLLFLFLIKNINVNPVSVGLKPILENPLYKSVKEIRDKDPEAKWVLFGQNIITSLIRSTGIKVVNGVKAVPQVAEMKMLDVNNANEKVYNRYAHINFNSYITPNDSVVFYLNENQVVNDNYSVYIDPCSEKLKKLDIKYFAFAYQPKPEEVRCMEFVKSDFNILFIYKVR